MNIFVSLNRCKHVDNCIFFVCILKYSFTFLLSFLNTHNYDFQKLKTTIRNKNKILLFNGKQYIHMLKYDFYFILDLDNAHISINDNGILSFYNDMFHGFYGYLGFWFPMEMILWLIMDKINALPKMDDHREEKTIPLEPY